VITIRRNPLIGIACGLVVLLSAGCGGGGGTANVTASNSDRSNGALTLNLTFPAYNRAAKTPKTLSAHTRGFAGNIPIGTQLVKLTVTNTTTNTLLASRSVNAPIVNGGLPSLVTINFAAIPAGPVTVTATAFPDLAGQLNAIATGSVSGTVQPLATTDLTVSMGLTLSSLTINPPSADLIAPPTSAQGSVVLNAVVVNAANKPLVLPIQWTTSDPGVASLTVSPSNPAQVTINSVAVGTSTITVYEPNSGLTATSIITVNGG
jgi:hypothetical protein